MIELRQLSKTFNAGKANEIKALRTVSLCLQPSSFTIIVGANGSGKSTLLNAISGVVRVDKGQIILSNNDITNLTEHKRSKWIARVFQNPMQGVAGELSILENFRLAALRTQRRTLKIGTGKLFQNLVREQVATLNMGLENKIQQPMATLSGGQRQALTLLMGAMSDAKVLLLDEPTAALDPKSAHKVLQLADEITTRSSITTVMITHSLKDALQYGDRIIQMDEGCIIRDISGQEKCNLQMADIYQWFE
jgi:putative ABC transport system ATP-binding protein